MKDTKLTPTAAELEILTILWKKQPQTVKEIHDTVAASKAVGYTTTLKIMQNMFGKGLLTRQPNGKSHLYFAAIKKEETQEKLLDRFLEATFSGSASNLVMQLLGNKKTSKGDIEEIKRIVDKMEQQQQQ